MQQSIVPKFYKMSEDGLTTIPNYHYYDYADYIASFHKSQLIFQFRGLIGTSNKWITNASQEIKITANTHPTFSFPVASSEIAIVRIGTNQAKTAKNVHTQRPISKSFMFLSNITFSLIFSTFSHSLMTLCWGEEVGWSVTKVVSYILSSGSIMFAC